jgi:hypothetical protein
MYKAETRGVGPTAEAEASIFVGPGVAGVLPIQGHAWAEAVFTYAWRPFYTSARIYQDTLMPLFVQYYASAEIGRWNMADASASVTLWVTRPGAYGRITLLRDQFSESVFRPSICGFDGCGSEIKPPAEHNFVSAGFPVLLPIGAGLPPPTLEVYGRVAARATGWQAEACASPGECVQYDASAVARAYLDPIITIDPNWEYADRFDWEVSPNVVQGAVVPESSTTLLLALGLVGLAMMRRRSVVH